MNVANTNINQTITKVKTDIDIQKAIRDKDMQIAALEFELQVQKSMLETLQRTTLQFISIF